MSQELTNKEHLRASLVVMAENPANHVFVDLDVDAKAIW